MLATSPEALATDPALIATILTGAMAGISRRLLESACPESHFEPLKHELILLARTYLNASSSVSQKAPDHLTLAGSDRS